MITAANTARRIFRSNPNIFQRELIEQVAKQCGVTQEEAAKSVKIAFPAYKH